MLNRIPVRAGDCHYLPSGTVHALGAGVMVAEVQNPSDVTYRVFDWNRVDPKTGRGRALHIDEALEAIHFGPEEALSCSPDVESSEPPNGFLRDRLVVCDSFTADRISSLAGGCYDIVTSGSVVWIALQGGGQVQYGDSAEMLTFGMGETVLLPAALPKAQGMWQPGSVWLEVTLPLREENSR